MSRTHLLPALAATILSLALYPAPAQTAWNDRFARDCRQPIDQAYTDHIRKYTADPQFSSRLVDYLPASDESDITHNNVQVIPVQYVRRSFCGLAIRRPFRLRDSHTAVHVIGYALASPEGMLLKGRHVQ